ncbi:helix-turn-helix transcriptional regulator [Carboxylicivirga mesophila]|uniref:Helix-turn-helix transcriptional regulator n=1 Tax=Carboxylicivirga mesophila TaxID=1166478 RepID=A0ABS5KBX7_9BACT|nr:helix-turn-helix domain-containing protein [Carboxylicivirga mesophila]MBS2212544.1 helix-turn-helix transcriptional regulator [Carboxylicivirga mesophila]
MKKRPTINSSQICKTRMQAITDAMSMLSGKWKFHIIGTLIEGDRMGFMDLMREVDGIGTKMLSKELQDLEINHLINRIVLNTKPVTVEYSISEYGKTLRPIIDEIANWGIAYRKSIMG